MTQPYPIVALIVPIVCFFGLGLWQIAGTVLLLSFAQLRITFGI